MVWKYNKGLQHWIVSGFVIIDSYTHLAKKSNYIIQIKIINSLHKYTRFNTHTYYLS